MPESITITRTIEVAHVKIESSRSFEDVRSTLESIVPQLDPGVVEFLRKGDEERAKKQQEEGPELSIFLHRDHGAILQIAGRRRNAVQYEIGNPLTATRMTRRQIPAALYAPLRIVLYENELGRGTFEYDKPSSLFGQFGDSAITEVARGLDAALERVLLRAAG